MTRHLIASYQFVNLFSLLKKKKKLKINIFTRLLTFIVWFIFMSSRSYYAFIYFQKVIPKSLRTHSGMYDLSPSGHEFKFTQISCIWRLLSQTGTTVALVNKLSYQYCYSTLLIFSEVIASVSEPKTLFILHFFMQSLFLTLKFQTSLDNVWFSFLHLKLS